MYTTILIPTMDNRRYLEPCLRSITHLTHGGSYRIVVVNNGARESCDWIDHPLVAVVHAGGNRGWTGGLALGLEHTGDPAVCFLNDDTLIPPGQGNWLVNLVEHLDDARIGAVGPASNCTIGKQSIFDSTAPLVIQVPILVGFCLVVRRQALDSAGGVDVALPGGDDIDLSIRLLKKSWLLLADRSVFVYHHGFVTGTRVFGPASMPGGWNSREYGAVVTQALLKKHGHEGLQLIGWEK